MSVLFILCKIARKRKIYDSRSTLYKSSTTSSTTTTSRGGGTYKTNKTSGNSKAEAENSTYTKPGSFSEDYYRRRYAPPKDQERNYNYSSSNRRRRHENMENLEDFIKDFEDLFSSPRRDKKYPNSYYDSDRSNPLYSKRGNRYQAFTLRNLLESTPFYRLFGKIEIVS